MSKEIPKERYLSPEERQKIIDNLRLIIIVYYDSIVMVYQKVIDLLDNT